MTEIKKETLCIHGGYERDNTRAITLPIYQSTAFAFDNADQGGNLFDLKEAGNIYSRLTNPTWDTLGAKINQLEGGVGALVTSSGQAATTFAILNICQAGDHIIAANNLYGGSYTLFDNTLKKLGIETTFIDPLSDAATISAAIKENTKAIYAETIGNPRTSVLDFEKFSAIAKEHAVPLIIDNTFASPYLFNPLKHGANIVTHSATKFLCGHGNAVVGVIVDGGNFDWNSGRFPEFSKPDESYHGLVYTEAFGSAAYILKARVQLIRDIGATASPFNAFLVNNGIETLHLRMRAHSENALALAEFLEQNDNIDWVSYPFLPSHPDYERAKDYFNGGGGAMLSFGIKGDLQASKNFIDALSLVIHAANLGDVRTIVSHPASTTHRQLSEEQLSATGITENLIRVSVGIESIDDIIADFKQALSKI